MKKGKQGRALYSHRMANVSGLVDTGKQTQANSFGPCLKHFFSMEEGASATQINDIVGGCTLGSITEHSDGYDPSVCQRLRNQTTTSLTTGSWAAAGNSDVIIISAGRMRFSSGDNGGTINLYMGVQNANGQLKVQPTHSVFSSGSAIADERPNAISTRYAHECAYRSSDDPDLIVAACMRGNLLEHWYRGTLTDSIEINSTRWNAQTVSAWNNFNPNSNIWFSHGPVGIDVVTCDPVTGLANAAGGDIPCTDTTFGAGGYTRPDGKIECPSLYTGQDGGVVEYAQDYYGFAVLHFADGAPNDLSEALPWMLDQWKTGNKVIWPGWTSLK